MPSAALSQSRREWRLITSHSGFPPPEISHSFSNQRYCGITGRLRKTKKRPFWNYKDFLPRPLAPPPPSVAHLGAFTDNTQDRKSAGTARLSDGFDRRSTFSDEMPFRALLIAAWRRDCVVVSICAQPRRRTSRSTSSFESK